MVIIMGRDLLKTRLICPRLHHPRTGVSSELVLVLPGLYSSDSVTNPQDHIQDSPVVEQKNHQTNFGH